jgi:NOL1/NOP2/fmu family ribosome biogenesis protein
MTSNTSQKLDQQATEPTKAARRTETAARPSASASAPPSDAVIQHHLAPHSREQAEARYVAARDAWAHAMHLATSGRPADLASLAIAQEAYELATAERERWNGSHAVPIAIEPEENHKGLEAIVGQEFEWRRVHDVSAARQARGIRRLFRRVTRRG